MRLHQHHWSFVSHFWTPRHNSGFGGVSEAHECGVKTEMGGLNRVHDAHDTSCWGAAGILKCAVNLNKTLNMSAAGSIR